MKDDTYKDCNLHSMYERRVDLREALEELKLKLQLHYIILKGLDLEIAQREAKQNAT
jgi:hypothetical protein